MFANIYIKDKNARQISTFLSKYHKKVFSFNIYSIIKHIDLRLDRTNMET